MKPYSLVLHRSYLQSLKLSHCLYNHLLVIEKWNILVVQKQSWARIFPKIPTATCKYWPALLRFKKSPDPEPSSLVRIFGEWGSEC